MTKNFLYSIGILIFIGILALSIILYGRGYRFNLNQKTITPTGILSVSSYPEGASVWLDGKLITATNSSISYNPGWYSLRIGKEGYQSWEKKIRIQGEVVTRGDALLIPNNPSLRTLTLTGISAPILSPNGDKVAFIVPDDEATFSGVPKSKKGAWVMELKNGPLGSKSEPRAIYQSPDIQDWYKASLIWSPDEKQIMLKFGKTENKKEVVNGAILLDSDNENLIPKNITSSWNDLLSDWKIEQQLKDKTSLEVFPLKLSDFLSTSAAKIRYSPDETKILYTATHSASLSQIITPPLIGSNTTEEVRNIVPNQLYIYDTKEDKNYYLADEKSFISDDSIKWYSDSNHIIMIENFFLP